MTRPGDESETFHSRLWQEFGEMLSPDEYASIERIAAEFGAGRAVQDDGLPGKMIEFALDYFLPLITRDFAGQDAQDRIDARMRASHALHNEYDRLRAAPPLHDPTGPAEQPQKDPGPIPGEPR